MFDRARSEGRKCAVWSLTAFGGFLALMAWKFFPSARQAAMQPPVTRENQERAKTAYEPTDWSLGPVALIYLGVPVLLTVSCLMLMVAFPGALPDVSRTLRIAPPGPRLQTDAAADLSRFRAEEEKRLNTYYWIDKQKGVVHVPIEQAMKELAKTGIPGFSKGQP